MMTILELGKVPSVSKIIIHSLDMSLYQAFAVVDGVEHLVTDKAGRPLRERSSLALQTLFEEIPASEMVLRHESCYDEMINQPVRTSSNIIEVPLGRNKLG
ncbi:MAG: DUF6482 family protein [Thalassolituus sp.]